MNQKVIKVTSFFKNNTKVINYIYNKDLDDFIIKQFGYYNANNIELIIFKGVKS